MPAISRGRGDAARSREGAATKVGEGLEPAGEIRWDAGEGHDRHEVGEGTPWRPPDLREDTRGGVSLDPWGRIREEDALAVAAVIFSEEWRQRAAIRNLWTRGHEPYGDGGGVGRVHSRAGDSSDSGRVRPDGRTTEQEHYRYTLYMCIMDINTVKYSNCIYSCCWLDSEFPEQHQGHRPGPRFNRSDMHLSQILTRGMHGLTWTKQGTQHSNIT